MTGIEWAVLAALIAVMSAVHGVKFSGQPVPDPWYKEVAL